MLLVATLVTLGGACSADATDEAYGVLQQATDYLRAREELAPTVVASRAELDGVLARDRACVVEMSGALSGMASCYSAADPGAPMGLVLDLPEGGCVALRSSSDVEELRLGEVVCVIAQVQTGSGASGELRVKVWVREWDLPEELRPMAQQAPADVEPVEPVAPVAPVEPEAPVSDRSAGGLPDPAASAAYPLATVQAWTAWVLEHSSKLSETQATDIVRWVLYYSQHYDVNHKLVFALIKWESWFDPSCVSHSGAIGLMQLMPGTARWMGVDPWNVQQNIDGGTHYLSEQLATHANKPNDQRVILALACYNAGPNAVKRAGGVPNIRETQRYVRKVSATFRELHEAGYP